MKKILSITLAVVMISALFIGTSIVSATTAVVGNDCVDGSGMINGDTQWQAYGWTLTDTMLTKFGYRINEGEPYWLVEDISETWYNGGGNYKSTTTCFLDSALHDAIVSYNLSNGLAEPYYSYRFGIILNAASLDDGDVIQLMGEFKNGDVMPILRTQTWTYGTVPTSNNVDLYLGDDLTYTTIGTKSGLSSAKRDSDGIVIIKTNDNATDPFIDINLPNVDASQYTGFSVKYKFDTDGDSTVYNNNYLRGKNNYKTYGATAGTFSSTLMIADGQWHMATYSFAANFPTMANEVLAGVRFICAQKGHTFRIEYIKFHSISSQSAEYVGWTSADRIYNGERTADLIGPGSTHKDGDYLSNTLIGDNTSIIAYGWIADSMKLYGTRAGGENCFGYQYEGEEPVFNSQRYYASDESAVGGMAGALGYTNGESVRFNVSVPLRSGYDQLLYIVAKMSDGTIKRVWTIQYAKVPDPSLGTNALSGVTLNGTAASGDIVFEKGSNAVLNAAGYAQVYDVKSIDRFGYKIDDGALRTSGDYIAADTAEATALRDRVDDAKNFGNFNVDVSGLDAGEHTLKLFAIVTNLKGAKKIEVEIDQIDFAIYSGVTAASITLSENLAINFKVPKAQFESSAFTNPSVAVSFNGGSYTLDTYTENGDYYVFSLTDIAPEFADEIATATLTVTRGGVDYTATPIDYSVEQYCSNKISSGTTNLQKLCYQTLVYAKAAQDYVTNGAGTIDLTGYSGLDIPYEEPTTATGYIDSANRYSGAAGSVKWKGVGLRLDDSVVVRVRFTADDITGLTVKYVVGGVERTVANADIIHGSGNNYTAYLTGISPNQMRDEINVTVMNGDTAVSRTLNYSIATYIKNKQDDAQIGDLVKTIMRYGDAAAAYVADPNN